MLCTNKCLTTRKALMFASLCLRCWRGRLLCPVRRLWWERHRIVGCRACDFIVLNWRCRRSRPTSIVVCRERRSRRATSRWTRPDFDDGKWCRLAAPGRRMYHSVWICALTLLVPHHVATFYAYSPTRSNGMRNCCTENKVEGSERWSLGCIIG